MFSPRPPVPQALGEDVIGRSVDRRAAITTQKITGTSLLSSTVAIGNGD